MKPFFVIWTGQAVSLLGSHLVQFALVWWLTKTTGSGTVLAVATMMALLPQIFLSPVAGALVDRWQRRRVMIVADGIIAAATVVLAALYASGVVQVWHIYVLMLIRAAGGAFHWPAMQASTTLMVPEKHFSRIAGLNQALFGAVGIVSPPLGALLMEVLPMQGILAIDVSTALLAIISLLLIAIPQPARKEAVKTTVLADMREGLRFVWSWKGLMLILLLATLLNMLVTPAFSLLPLMVREHFGGGALHLAWLESAWAIGMVIGGITLSVWGGLKRRVVTAMLAVTMMGVGITGVGLAPATGLALAVVALFFGGFMNPIANGSLFATLQVTVPPEMQGRVFTLVMSGSAAMSPLGLAVAGPVADLVGVRIWFVMGGIATILLGAGSFFIPAIMHVEDQVGEITPSDVAAAVQPATLEPELVP